MRLLPSVADRARTFSASVAILPRALRSRGIAGYLVVAYEHPGSHGWVDRAVGRLAGGQHGAFSHRQLVELGITPAVIRRRVELGRWERLYRGVYCLAGVPLSWQRSIMAACLFRGADARASHQAAAQLWGLPGGRPLLEVSILRRPVREHPDIVTHRVLSLPDADVTRVAGIPVTTAARTVLDLAATSPSEVLEEMVSEVLRRRLTTPTALRRRVQASAPRAGTRSLRAVLDLAAPRAGSALEARLLRLIRRNRLPVPVAQHEIRDGSGRLVARLDLAYPDGRLAIEADGFRWHGSRARWRSDLRRRNELTRLGWRVIHVTWEQIASEPGEVIAAIRFALAASRLT